MRPIFKIAKAELRSLYYSPILWFVSIVFLIQCGLVWFRILMQATDDQDWMVDVYGAAAYFSGEGFPGSLTFGLLGSNPALKNGLLDMAVLCMYLFIPVLTMGVINREKNSYGTFKLLYSSPVRFRQIVLGKYVGLAIFNLLLVAILLVFFLLTGIYVKSPDIGAMFSMALGFYLLVCAYTAIGFFMSALSNYQLVSAIGTFLVLALLGQAGNFFQRIDFVRDLTWFLSISGRAERMFRGLIVSRDVIYFLSVIALFLSFSLLKLKGTQQAGSWFIKVGRYVAVLMVVLITGYISSRPALTAYWDTTATQANTIPDEYQHLLDDLGEEPVEITIYTNLLLGDIARKGLPENRNNYLADLWDPFLRFKPDLQFRYEYYYHNDPSADDSTLIKSFYGKTIDEIAAFMAKEQFDIELDRFKKPDQIDKELNLKKEGYQLVMQLRYKDRTTFLRTGSNGVWPLQTGMIAAFKKLLTGKSPPIYYITGHWERNIFKKGEREYKEHSADKGSLTSLINSGYAVDTLSLEHGEIPEDASLLVLADPKSALEPQVVAKLQQYLEAGGNMFILGEPGKQEILNPLLKPLGVYLKSGQWVAATKHESADKVYTIATNTEFLLGKYFNYDNFSYIRKKADLLMPGLAMAVITDSNNFKVTQFMTNHQPGWNKEAWWTPDSLPPVFDHGAGDTKGGFSALIGLTRKVNEKEQRVLISGDADFMSNVRLPSTRKQPMYITALYSWLTNFEYPLPIAANRELKDNFLRDINSEKAANLKIVIIWILPALLLIIATVLLVRRKRK